MYIIEGSRFVFIVPLKDDTKRNKSICFLLLLIIWAICLILMIFGILTWINYEPTTTKLPKLRFITRDDWIAQPPDNHLKELVLPVNRAIITHTATEGCDTQAQCVYRVRIIQTFHMESKKLDDIGYNFLVGGDGAIYEGRGWDKRGAHTLGYNEGSIGIAFIGTFTKSTPPKKQFDALKLLLDQGVCLGKLTKNYKMYPHRAFFGTESPGEKIMEVLKTWPHYTATFLGTIFED